VLALAVGALLLAAALAEACGGEAGARAAAVGADPAAQWVGGRDSALVRAAREVLPAVEAESGLTAQHPLAVARTSREQLESYMLGEFHEELPPGRARAVEETYVRLGLLPDSLDLVSFLRKLYVEQVVGYYDATRDTLYVREGVQDEEFRPVLVHEMVHALQDQHMDLDSLLEAREDDNDASTAAHAALEGQATYVMLEWLVRQRTGSKADLTRMPQVVDMVSGADLLSAGAASMPELAAAPAFIRSSLVFPYQAGLSFMQALWTSRKGRPAPLGADMPASTEQVMHPDHFLSSPRDAPTEIEFETDSAAPEGGWRVAHSDDLGEFETRFFLSAFLGDTARADSASTGWDGDRYRLLRRCGSAGDSRCAEAFVWASVWDGPGWADAFAAAARRAFAARYGVADSAAAIASGVSSARPGPRSVTVDTLSAAGRVIRVRRLQVSGRPAVLVIDGPLGADPDPIAAAGRFRIEGGP